MTMDIDDFIKVLKRPKDLVLGAVAQFGIMPGLAFLLSTAFNLDPALTAGVVLVGTCPGDTASNVITFMSNGDLALSVAMTTVSTLLAPIMTPLLTYLIIGQKIAFDPIGMFWSIVQIVIIPIAIGLAVKSFLPKFAAEASNYTPAVSAMAISFIIAGVIGASRDNILKASGIILLVVMLHNVLGYVLGFIVARITGLSWKKAIALSIEVGMSGRRRRTLPLNWGEKQYLSSRITPHYLSSFSFRFYFFKLYLYIIQKVKFGIFLNLPQQKKRC